MRKRFIYLCFQGQLRHTASNRTCESLTRFLSSNNNQHRPKFHFIIMTTHQSTVSPYTQKTKSRVMVKVSFTIFLFEVFPLENKQSDFTWLHPHIKSAVKHTLYKYGATHTLYLLLKKIDKLLNFWFLTTTIQQSAKKY